jgi:hypothetical protein
MQALPGVSNPDLDPERQKLPKKKKKLKHFIFLSAGFSL